MTNVREKSCKTCRGWLIKPRVRGGGRGGFYAFAFDPFAVHIRYKLTRYCACNACIFCHMAILRVRELSTDDTM